MKSDKSFVYIVRSADYGMRHWSLHNRSMVLFISWNTSLGCSSDDERIVKYYTQMFL